MRALCWLALGIAGCGGDKDEADTAADTDVPGGSPEDRCEGIPLYTLSGQNCDQLASAWDGMLGAADRCTRDENCQVVRAPCEHWTQVECYYVANDCIDTSRPQPTSGTELPTLADFNTATASCGGQNLVCECNTDPVAKCVNERCVLEFPPYQ